jgi:hypothetical protein
MFRHLFPLKHVPLLALLAFHAAPLVAQIDKDQLALQVYRADTANTRGLMPLVWKRSSAVSVDGQVKLTTLTEFSFDEKGELQYKLVDAQSSVQQKPGIRGQMQKNAAEDKADYVQKALALSLGYTFMTKGELIDFFTKATVTEKDGLIEATASDVRVKGDKVVMWFDAKTKLPVRKWFSSFLGADAITGQMDYAAFASGVVHGTTTVLDMPAQKMRISAENKDYTQRIR